MNGVTLCLLSRPKGSYTTRAAENKRYLFSMIDVIINDLVTLQHPHPP
jgi:hypothetical protein